MYLLMIGVITMDLPKRYSDFLNEITSDEIYKGLLAYGMFTEKIPPIFSAESFVSERLRFLSLRIREISPRIQFATLFG